MFCENKESIPAKERNLMMQKSAIVEIELISRLCVSLYKPQATLYYPRFFAIIIVENNAVERISLIFIPFIISFVHIFRYGMR